MKKFIVAGLMLTSMNVFSQSYLILDNGVILTTDKASYVYDFGHFRLPYKVNLNGGQFFIADQKLSTVDSAGFLYEKALRIEKVRAYGLNYIVTDKNKLITIDENGFYYELDTDSKLLRNAVLFSGNYFLVKPEPKKALVELYTVNSKGNYTKISLPELNPAEISAQGGAYFQVQSGMVFTISKDGFVFSKPEVKVGEIKKAGGNFLIDSENRLYTISEDGLLLLPLLPENLKVANIEKVGANYMLDTEGRIFLVDKAGALAERTIGHDLKKTKIHSSF